MRTIARSKGGFKRKKAVAKYVKVILRARPRKEPVAMVTVFSWKIDRLDIRQIPRTSGNNNMASDKIISILILNLYY